MDDRREVLVLDAEFTKGESMNPYEAPKAPPASRQSGLRRSWMRFVPAVFCGYFGVVLVGVCLFILGKSVVSARSIHEAGLHSALLAMPPWVGVIFGIFGLSLLRATALWVKARYRNALILSVATFGLLKVSGELLKLMLQNHH